MHSPWRLLVFSTLVIATTGDAALTRSEKRQLIKAHNDLRRSDKLSPRPCTPLNSLKWRRKLAKVAQAKAKTCVQPKRLQGDPTEEKASSTQQYRVREVAILTRLHPVNLAAKIRELFYEDRQYFNYTTNTCLHERGCDHYTQLILNESTYFGCGKHACPEITLSREEASPVVGWNALLFVCYYVMHLDNSQSSDRPYRTCELKDIIKHNSTGNSTVITQQSTEQLKVTGGLSTTDPPVYTSQVTALQTTHQPNLMRPAGVTPTRQLNTEQTLNGQRKGSVRPIVRSGSREKVRHPKRAPCSHVPNRRCRRNRERACQRERDCFKNGLLYRIKFGSQRRVLYLPSPKQCGSDGFWYATRCLLFSAICQGKVNNCVRRVRKRCCTRTPAPKPTLASDLLDMLMPTTAVPAVTCEGYSGGADHCEKESRTLCGRWWLKCLITKRTTPLHLPSGSVQQHTQCTSDYQVHANQCDAMRHICLHNMCARPVAMFCCQR